MPEFVKTNLLDIRTQPLDALDNLSIEFRREAANRSALLNALDDRGVHALVAIAENDGAVAEPEIDKLPARAVNEAAALHALDEDGGILAPISIVLGDTERHVVARTFPQ